MTSTDIATQKDILRKQKNAITEELSRFAIYHEDTDDWEARFDFENKSEADGDLISDASEAADEQIATLALLETDYRNIVRALKKIEQGTYGICEIGGEMIETTRLQIQPAARTCMIHMDKEADLPL